MRIHVVLFYFPLYIFHLIFTTNLLKYEETLVWISLDGFPHSFYNETNSPNMYSFGKKGVYAKNGLLSSFVTNTFPNHFTQATGLDIEVHGIIANDFMDENGHQFTQDTIDEKIWDPKGDLIPIWTANQLNSKDRASAVLNWPGNSVKFKNVLPMFYYETFEEKGPKEIFTKIIELLKEKKYSLIMAYIPAIDKAGHVSGPESPEFLSTIRFCDSEFGKFIQETNEKISKNINIMVTSDHGMKQLSSSKVVSLDELSTVKFTSIMEGPVGLFNTDHNDTQSAKMVSELNSAANGKFIAYTKGDLPEEYHYSKNPRIPDIIVIGLNGWSIQSKKDDEFSKSPRKGGHGYPNQIEPEMTAVFFANGPLFPQNGEISSLKAIDLYPWVCNLLKITKSCGLSNGKIPEIETTVKPSHKGVKITISLIFIGAIGIIVGIGVFYWIKKRRNRSRTQDYFQIDPLLRTEDSEEMLDLEY